MSEDDIKKFAEEHGGVVGWPKESKIDLFLAWTQEKRFAFYKWVCGNPPFILDDPMTGIMLRKIVSIHPEKFGVRLNTIWCGFFGLWFCPCCGRFSRGVMWRRRNTAYLDDRSNWLASCQDCYDEDFRNFEEQWEEYYSSRF